MPSSPYTAASVADALDEVRPGTRFGPSGDQHEIGEELGAGAAARVFACVRVSTREQLAVKVINLQRLQLLGDLEQHIEKLDREVQILRVLRHERVVNLHNVHRTANWYFLVMERIRGGELFDQIVQNKSLTETESRYVFRQLLEGVGYMHAKNVIHRDLKPENILIVKSRPIGPPGTGHFRDVKIADFGLSKVISETTSFAKTLVGTPQYYAPEVLNVQNGGGTYDQAADLWGLGVVLYVMLSGRYPFDGKKAPLEEQIRTASFNMSTKRWANISEVGKELVQGLLRVDPRERLRLEHCACHPWVLDGSSVPNSVPVYPGITSPLLTSVEEEPLSRCQSGFVLDDAAAAPTTPLPSGGSTRSEVPSCGSSCEVLPSSRLGSSPPATAELTDDARAASQVWLLSRLWFVAVYQWWRRSRGAQFLFIGLCLLLCYLCRVRIYLDSGESEPLAPLPVFPRYPVDMPLIVPTVPLLSPGGPHNVEDHRLGGESGGAQQCPEHPGDGALLDGCRSSNAPPHPGVPPLPGMAPRVPSGMSGDLDEEAFTQKAFPQLGANSSAMGEQETIFRLSELLKLQVSIAGSLEMARLAFRHADPELAEATRQTSRQARDLFQHAANVVSRYAQVAQQVSQFVLPDLHLAVQEREPNLAGSLLNMVKEWVVEMKDEGQRTQQRYVALQASVLSLARRAQESKTGADRRLFEAAKAVEAEPSLSSTSSGSGQAFTLAPSLGDCVSPASGGGSKQQDLSAAAAQGAVEMPPSLNSWTKQLFEQLSELTSSSGKGNWDRAGDVPMITAEPQHTRGVNHDDVAWRRDLVDLLFMAPGVATSSLPKFEALNFAAETNDDKDSSFIDGVHVEDDSGDGSAQRSDPGSAVVRYVHTENVKSEAETASHSAAALLRALRELKRVDGILHGCSAFWANMDGTVQRLAQMKEHTASLVNFASKSARLRERFDQRLGEYVSFWGALERLCRQYCLDHQAAAGRMNEFIRDMTDAADVIDTAESAKAGVILARNEKQLRHRYKMDVYQQPGD